MEHDLKVWPEYFEKMVSGIKLFEVRKDDRNFQVGDTLMLREWFPKGRKYEGYTSDWICRKITYKLSGGNFGIEKGFCVLGFRNEIAIPKQEPRGE